MKKIFFLVVVLVFVALSVNAQNKKEVMPFTFNGGLTLAHPEGDANSHYGYVWGLDLQGVMNVAPSFDATLSLGYLEYGRRVGHYRIDFIPILVGGKYYFTDMIYGSLQVGMEFATSSGGGSIFVVAPAVGVKITDHFDISLKYQTGTKNSYSYGYVGLRGAYTF